LGRPSGSATRARPFDDLARLAIRFWNRSPTHCPRSPRFNSNQLAFHQKKNSSLRPQPYRRRAPDPSGAAPPCTHRRHPSPLRRQVARCWQSRLARLGLGPRGAGAGTDLGDLVQCRWGQAADIHVACWGAWSPMRSNHSYHSHGSCSAGGAQVFHSFPPHLHLTSSRPATLPWSRSICWGTPLHLDWVDIKSSEIISSPHLLNMVSISHLWQSYWSYPMVISHNFVLVQS